MTMGAGGAVRNELAMMPRIGKTSWRAPMAHARRPRRKRKPARARDRERETAPADGTAETRAGTIEDRR